jgi:hypothetical protein
MEAQMSKPKKERKHPQPAKPEIQDDLERATGEGMKEPDPEMESSSDHGDSDDPDRSTG